MEDNLNQNDREMIDDMFAHLGFDSDEFEAINEAQRDMLGSANTPVPLQRQDLDAALEGFQQALQNLPPEKKQAYFTAVERNPEVVKLESPAERFLLFNNYDYWKAAEQMIKYWTERREVFGKEKYSLPMRLKPLKTASSEGPNTVDSATKDSEIQSCISDGGQISIQSGMRLIVPPDKFGRFVFMIDREKIIPRWEDPQNRLQAQFYFLQVMSEAEQAVTKGFVCVAAFESGESRNQHKPDGSTIQLVQSGALPIRLRALHMIQIAPEKSILAKETLKLFVSAVQNFSSVDFRRRTCFYDSQQQALDDLKDYGIYPYHLPKRFGGMVDHEFSHWLMHRIPVERQRYSILCEKNDTKTQTKRPRTPDQEDRDQYIKRQRAEFRWRNRERVEKHKIRKEHGVKEMLQQHNKVLLARLEVARTLAGQYEEDKKSIRRHVARVVANFLPTMSGAPAAVVQDPAQSAMLASVFVDNYLRFAGRHPQTGKWIFLMPSNSTSLSQSAMMDLCWLRDDLLRLQPTLMNQNDCKKESSEQDPSLRPGTEDAQIAELERKIRSLQKESTKSKETNRFLEGLLVCSRDAADQHEDDKRQIKASMLKIFVKLPSLVPAVEMLIAHVLDNHTTYNGRTAVNEERTEWKPMYYFNPRDGDPVVEQLQELARSTSLANPSSKVNQVHSPNQSRAVANIAMQGTKEMRKNEIEQQAEQRWREARAKRKRDLKRL